MLIRGDFIARTGKNGRMYDGEGKEVYPDIIRIIK